MNGPEAYKRLRRPIHAAVVADPRAAMRAADRMVVLFDEMPYVHELRRESLSAVLARLLFLDAIQPRAPNAAPLAPNPQMAALWAAVGAYADRVRLDRGAYQSTRLLEGLARATRAVASTRTLEPHAALYHLLYFPHVPACVSNMRDTADRLELLADRIDRYYSPTAVPRPGAFVDASPRRLNLSGARTFGAIVANVHCPEVLDTLLNNMAAFRQVERVGPGNVNTMRHTASRIRQSFQRDVARQEQALYIEPPWEDPY